QEAMATKNDQQPPSLRRRHVREEHREEVQNVKNEMKEDIKQHRGLYLEPGTYWLTRIVFLRSLGFIYFVAFLVAYHQNKQLVGKDGLLPGDLFLNRIKEHTGGLNIDTFTIAPTIAFFFDYEKYLDLILDGLAVSGLVMSSVLIWRGSANIILMLMMWIVYHSICNIGQRWYGFGWESQILETGFLAAFMCPLFTTRQLPRNTPTSRFTIWGYRWLIFRIMLGAGLIKIRGDKCWRDLTCMDYHYETQCVPNPMAYFMHQSPVIFHRFETLTNHFVELIAPWFILLPFRRLRIAGGVIQILFQVLIIISGNLSFLNWLTILPAIACFDDKSLAFLFSNKVTGLKIRVKQIQIEVNQKSGPNLTIGCYIRKVFNLSLGLLIAYLSIPVVQNLMSTRQAMNTSFDPLRIVNTYGAFGSITKERTEVIFQGTHSINPNDPDAKWEEYEFKCKPGDVFRRPCLISPYHYRLDWLMWFAAFQNYQQNDWLIHLAAKFLVNDKNATSLIAYNPFEGREPPKFIRAEHFRYQFTKIGSKAAQKGQWWKRKHIGNYLPPLSLDSLKDYIKQKHWKHPQLPR
ncbi:unnamed protein product, partial [Owenia fusiformis]